MTSKVTLSDLLAKDDGYGDTNIARFVVKNGKLGIQCHRRPSFLTSGFNTNLAGAIGVEVESGKETLQYTAVTKTMNTSELININSDQYPGSNYNAALIAAMVGAIDYEVTDNTHVVTGLPVQNFYDLSKNSFKLSQSKFVEEKKKSLGSKAITVHTEEKSFSYSIPTSRQFVVSEATGVLIDLLFNSYGERINNWIFEGQDSDAYLIVIDMGSRTTDIAALTENLKLERSILQTIEVGLNDVHAKFRDMLLADNELSHRSGLTASTLTQDKVREIFTKGYVVSVRGNRERLSVTQYTELAFSSIVRDRIIPQLGYVREDLSKVAAIVLAGGGAAIGGYMQQAIRSEMILDEERVNENKAKLDAGEPIQSDSEPNRMVLCSKQPEYANVRGFLKWLAFMHLKIKVTPELLEALELELAEVA